MHALLCSLQHYLQSPVTQVLKDRGVDKQGVAHVHDRIVTVYYKNLPFLTKGSELKCVIMNYTHPNKKDNE